MTGICGHLPGTTCSNCVPRSASIAPWPPSPPDALGRIADALEKMIDAYTQAQRRDHYALNDRYAANEARQREEATEPTRSYALSIAEARHLRHHADDKHAPDAVQKEARLGLIECLQEIERTRPGSDDQPTSEQFQEGLALAYDWLRSALRDHGVGVSSRPEPDPLDEDDHRDRVCKDGDGERLMRSFRGHWHTPDFDCRRYCRPMTDDDTAFMLAAWNKDCGPIAFAPDAVQEYTEPNPLDEDDHRDRVDAEGGPCYRNPGGCWHTSKRDCTGCVWTLARLSKHYGPLTFAPDAVQEYAVNDVRQQEAQMEDAWQSRDWDSVSRLQDEAQQREEAVIDYEDIREGMTIEAAYSNGTRFRFVATRGYAYWSDPSGCFRIMPPGTEGLDLERVIRLIAPPAAAIDNTPPFDQED